MKLLLQGNLLRNQSESPVICWSHSQSGLQGESSCWKQIIFRQVTHQANLFIPGTWLSPINLHCQAGSGVPVSCCQGQAEGRWQALVRIWAGGCWRPLGKVVFKEAEDLQLQLNDALESFELLNFCLHFHSDQLSRLACRRSRQEYWCWGWQMRILKPLHPESPWQWPMNCELSHLMPK